MQPPPIPARCAHRPTTGGYVIPFGNVQLADGGCDYRSHHTTRMIVCILDRRCQVCGNKIEGLISLLGGPEQLETGLFTEPPIDPVCARYVTQACPMVRGDRTHFASGPPLTQRHRGATCPDPGCDCGGFTPTPGTTSNAGGGPAHPWWEIQVWDYAVVKNPDGRVWAVQPIGTVARRRLISTPPSVTADA